MKPSKMLSLIVLFFTTTTVFSQSFKESQTVTINTKSNGMLIGKIVSESSDTIKLATEHFGIVGIARKEIISDIPILIVTKDGNQYNGIVVADNDKSIDLRTIYLDVITIQKKDIKYEGSKDGFSKIGKNAISFNFLGPTPIAGVTYERLLSKNIGIELGIGFPSFGAGLKVYPGNVQTDKFMFHTGLVGSVLTDGAGQVGVVYIPLGLSYFGERDFNFGIDVGPGYASDFGMIPWGNIKLGLRF